MAVVHIPAYFSYSGELFLASSYLQQSKAFVHGDLTVRGDCQGLGNSKLLLSMEILPPTLLRTGSIVAVIGLTRVNQIV